MLDLTRYLTDDDVIDYYSQNFNEDDLEEFIGYCNKTGITKEWIGMMMLDYNSFLEMWWKLRRAEA